ncbi:HtaA domain-containing protein [Gordonia sp. X0973]|uniref:HtaA domain-containing protein n=1 Tax=Gordonia sp. X0973 TaxID=2742602 RepID=UPI000F52CCC0|nr:HtaA domain-containing protein [Gordonia sp. X0973]QKT05978.1 HtaA domain-containing protein [Gordonia sp. X0973]
MRRLLGILAAATAMTAAFAPATAPTAVAAPGGPAVNVYLADGRTPVGATVTHPGDKLVVKGRGFDPNANTSGFPVPVPPGVPHGTFIAFGAFAPHWRPSAGAPESARATARSGVQWAMAPQALNRVPTAPFDFRRTIRQQWVPLHADGTFTATLTLATPKSIPAGARWGVYTYGAAGSDNAAQELAVPVSYSTAPGPNTPRTPAKNLVWGYSPSFYRTFAKTTQGSVTGSDGATVDKVGRMSFEQRSGTLRDGNGILRFRGTIVASTRFHLYEVALVDPVLSVRNGHGVLSMRTSTTNMNGTDATRRIDIADVDLRGVTADGKRSARVTFRPGISPQVLALLSTGPAAPMDLVLTAR